MRISDSIQVDWRHDVPAKTTTCVLTKGDQQFTASSKCGHGDQFNRKVGRKITLGRVLPFANLSKAERKDIWTKTWPNGVNV
jgi:hypothetical protein